MRFLSLLHWIKYHRSCQFLSPLKKWCTNICMSVLMPVCWRARWVDGTYTVWCRGWWFCSCWRMITLLCCNIVYALVHYLKMSNLIYVRIHMYTYICDYHQYWFYIHTRAYISLFYRNSMVACQRSSFLTQKLILVLARLLLIWRAVQGNVAHWETSFCLTASSGRMM